MSDSTGGRHSRRSSEPRQRRDDRRPAERSSSNRQASDRPGDPKKPARSQPRASRTLAGDAAAVTHRQLGPTPVKVVLAIIAVVLLAAGGYAYSAVGDLDSNLNQADGLDLGDQKDGATDILLVGIDSRTDAKGNPLTQEQIDMLRAGEAETTSTDTMILIRIPNDGSSATAVSLPRDTYVDGGDDLGNTKLNGVYGGTKYNKTQELEEQAANSGDQPDERSIDEKSTQAGREALVHSIADLTGITVDHYAEVGLLGFQMLTDAVGGVDVCLNNPVDEPLSGAKFPAGRQTLNGQDALSFVRQRHDLPRGDLDRITRQQAYLASLSNKILSSKTLTDRGMLNRLNEAIASSVTIDSGWDIMSLATQMQNLSGGNVTFQTIPVTSIDGTSDDGSESVVTVNPDQVHSFFKNLLGDDDSSDSSESSESAETSEEAIPDYDPAGATVNVFNAGSVGGLASRVGDLVSEAGYGMGEVGNHDESGVSESQVNVADTNDPAARGLAKQLGGLKVVEDTSLAPGTISVTLANDYSGPGATEDDTRSLSDDSSADGADGSGDDSSGDDGSIGIPGTMGDSSSEDNTPIDAGGDGLMCVN
jgi:LCP family protein required for cell wall assembly